MQKGPFAMNYVTGMTVNIISVLWLIFAIVFFSFPFEMPATGKPPIVTLLSYRSP